MKLLRTSIFSLLFAIALNSSLAAQTTTPSKGAAGDGTVVLEQGVRNPSLTPVFVTEPNGNKVRELRFVRDVSYNAFSKVIISYMDSSMPSEPKRTFSQWSDIFIPATPDVSSVVTVLRASPKTFAEKLSFAEYRNQIIEQRNKLLLNPSNIKESVNPETLFRLNLSNVDVLAAERRLVATPNANALKSLSKQQFGDRQSAAALIDPASIILGMTLLQNTIDGALDRADEIATSQLFALREHLAISIQDMNVVFKDRLNQTFDKLTEREQVAVNTAMQLSYDTQIALDDLENKGFAHASDLLCQAAVAAAQLNLLPIFKRAPSPDLLCITTPYIRDAGTLHERFLTFRGISLRKGGDYPDASLIIPTPDKHFTLPAAGGDTIIQMPLPGGINGGSGDPASERKFDCTRGI